MPIEVGPATIKEPQVLTKAKNHDTKKQLCDNSFNNDKPKRVWAFNKARSLNGVQSILVNKLQVSWNSPP